MSFRGFFQPRDLTPLSLEQLDSYLTLCLDTLDRNRDEHGQLTGAVAALRKGIISDGIWTIGGLAIAAASIVATPIVGAAGFLTLLGGAGSLQGFQGYLSRRGTVHLAEMRLRELQRSTEHCRREIARIDDELRRRSGP